MGERRIVGARVEGVQMDEGEDRRGSSCVLEAL